MTHLLCPLDNLPLQQELRSFRCERGHCFDLAKQGYLNLLPVQNKRSKDPGDSKEMVRARRDFLEGGWYRSLRDWFVQQLVSDLAGIEKPVVFDAGCGEGYYTQALHSALAEQGLQPEIYGLDISKWALMSAGKRSKTIHWIVGSNRQLPLPDSSVDLLFCAFGFYSLSEFARVLRPGGRLALLDPAENHLLALREQIYPEVRRSGPPSLEAAEAAGFSTEVESVSFQGKTGALDQEALEQLLCMTPHLYRAPAEGIENVRALSSLNCQLDVQLRWLTRR